MFHGFDGLMTLSRREGVDIRPTLLRVLTDLYVQAGMHTADEERQFVELASRLIDQVDDSTRAVVRARLSIYPKTPPEIARKLGLQPARGEQTIPLAPPLAPEHPAAPPPAKPPSEVQTRLASHLSMQPNDALQINDIFFSGNASERAQILHNLADTPLRPATRVYGARAERAILTLRMAAYAQDSENFAREIGDVLILPRQIAEQAVKDPGGEPLACAAKALGMPSEFFQQVLMFLDPEFGAQVNWVHRLARLYDLLSERSALIMIAAWRGATMAATRAKYRPTLYDDERQRARSAAAQTKPAAQPGIAVPRPGFLRGSGD
jgi:uncharacterized protein (DUF2336 family)